LHNASDGPSSNVTRNSDDPEEVYTLRNGAETNPAPRALIAHRASSVAKLPPGSRQISDVPTFQRFQCLVVSAIRSWAKTRNTYRNWDDFDVIIEEGSPRPRGRPSRAALESFGNRTQGLETLATPILPNRSGVPRVTGDASITLLLPPSQQNQFALTLPPYPGDSTS